VRPLCTGYGARSLTTLTARLVAYDGGDDAGILFAGVTFRALCTPF